jgi:5-methyltetrahydrofolate--homocysteine methyltransferase
MDVRERLRVIFDQRIVIGDGAIGTLLQMCGLAPGQPPEMMLLDNPGSVKDVHRMYIDAGADILTTNTFGANRPKLALHGLEGYLETINCRAVEMARKVSGENNFVAASIGPTGELLRPMGSLTVPELVTIYREQVRVLKKAGADFAILETMTDLGEIQAAGRACFMEGFPFMASMVFNESGRSLTGATPGITAITLEAYNPIALGANCGSGPKGMVRQIMEFSEVSPIPILAQPNAGLPEFVDGKTVFRLSPDDFAQRSIALVEAGAAVVGGCCGTTPDHIATLKQAISKYKPVHRSPVSATRFAARSGSALAGRHLPFCVIGERINPTGRKRLSRQLAQMDFSGIRRDATAQVKRGADILDINVGIPDIDEAAVMVGAIDEIQALLPGTPLSIDSNDPETLAAGLHYVIGRPLLNSINGSNKRMERLLPLVVETGANFIALAMDDGGMPQTTEARIAIIRKIINQAEKLGINRNRILVDALVFTVASQPAQPGETLKTVRRITDELGCATILGVSNVSFGLPAREAITSAFLSMAMVSGLTAGIINPLSDRIIETVRASELLLNRDPGASRYVACMDEIALAPLKTKSTQTSPPYQPVSTQPIPSLQPDTVLKAMLDGDRSGLISVIDDLLGSGKSPARILSQELAPAIQEVGKLYGNGTIFLPQLILAGEAMRAAVAHIRPLLAEHRAKELHGTPLIIGTVEGDIHDIGKNIVAIVLENQGFDVKDLGKNVSPDRFVSAVSETHAPIVALSALMTTTMPAMEKTVTRLRENHPGIAIMVGGAVVTQTFADRIGADGYAKEAVDAGILACKLAGLNRL